MDKMEKKNCTVFPAVEAGESGQAMLELLVLLFALIFLVVGLVVLSAIEGAENAHLLRNKYLAEMSARSDAVETVSSGEIGFWSRHSLKLYRNGGNIEIPFSRHDRQFSTSGSIDGASYRLRNDNDSASGNYTYRYFDMEGFRRHGGRLTSMENDDAMNAARLVQRNASADEDGRNSDEGVAAGVRNVLSGVFRELFGRIPDPADNITNRVYMPLQEE